MIISPFPKFAAKWCLLIVVLASMNGCVEFPCEDIDCNNGYCDEGTCVCEAGWEGEFCDQMIDNCLGVDCNNGTCNDGLCTCDPGYEGEFCDSTIAAKFAGTYRIIARNCSTSTGNTNYTISISASSSQPGTILLLDLYNESFGLVPGSVLSDGRSFTIPSTADPASGDRIDGQGIIDVSHTTITLTYNISNFLQGGVYDRCNVTLEKL